MTAPTQTQVQFFMNNGYLQAGRILTEEELAAARAAADREIAAASGEVVMEQDAVKAVPRRISKVIQRNDEFRSVAMHPIVIDFLSVLLDSPFEVCLNRHNMLMVKAAHHGGQVDWHQDAGYWQCSKFISLMVMLDDATLANGCLQLVPGVHNLPEFQNADPMMDMTAARNREIVNHAVPIECKAGEGFFFHSLAPHFSGPNRSPASRRSLNFAYVASRDLHLASKPYPLESIAVHRE